jgi:hypothetical protein
MNSGLGNFSGAITDDFTSPCITSFVSQMIVGAHVALSRPAPTVLACQATGSVGPNGLGGSPTSGPLLMGPTSGTGSCRSADSGSWNLQYTGIWWEGYGSNAWCPGDYNLDVTLTRRTNGRTLHQQQTWLATEQNGEHVFQVESYPAVPVGAGTISESPDACTYPMSMSTAATFVLVIP